LRDELTLTSFRHGGFTKCAEADALAIMFAVECSAGES
jgi:hypothetical protein